MNNSVQPNTSPSPSDSSDTIAMVLEIIFGFFGILGMGWLYAGNIPVAIAVFVGFLIIAFIELAIAAATLGIGACCIVPFNIAVAIVSGLRARDYVRNSGARGSLIYVVIGVVIGGVILCIGSMVFFGGLAALGELSSY